MKTTEMIQTGTVLVESRGAKYKVEISADPNGVRNPRDGNTQGTIVSWSTALLGDGVLMTGPEAFLQGLLKKCWDGGLPCKGVDDMMARINRSGQAFVLPLYVVKKSGQDAYLFPAPVDDELFQSVFVGCIYTTRERYRNSWTESNLVQDLIQETLQYSRYLFSPGYSVTVYRSGKSSPIATAHRLHETEICGFLEQACGKIYQVVS